MAYFILPFLPALGLNGQIASGAKLFFYLTETSTLTNVYADDGLTTPLTNPVVANDSGRFVDIFIDPGVTYRVRLETSAGALIDEVDPLPTANADGITFTQSGTGSITRTVQDKLRDTISVADKGTTADLLTALQSAETDLDSGGLLHVPRGAWTLSGTFTADGQRMNVLGDGRNVSIVSFSPATADVALEYNNVSAGGMFQGSIKNLGFTSSNSVAKTAIRLVNCADTEVSGIGIPGGAWLGSASIGIQVLGRQSLNLHTCEIVCARPLVISQNATFPSLNTDHFKIGGAGILELTTTEATGKCIEIESNVMVTTCSFENLAITGGKYGIFWDETSSVGASYGLVIDKLRREQSADPTGYSIYISLTSQSLQTLAIRDSYLDEVQNGIYIRNALNVTIENVVFAMNAGETAIDMTFVAGSHLIMKNCIFQAGSTVTFTNAICVRRENITGIGFIEEWVFKANTASGAIASDVYNGGVPFSIANNAVVAIADNSFVGFIDVSSTEDVSATYVLRGATQSVGEVSDPDGFFTATVDNASSYNIYWDAGTSRYVIQNKRGTTQTLSVYRRGSQL